MSTISFDEAQDILDTAVAVKVVSDDDNLVYPVIDGDRITVSDDYIAYEMIFAHNKTVVKNKLDNTFTLELVDTNGDSVVMIPLVCVTE